MIHSPSTQEGKIALSQQIASVHAEAISHHIRRLTCPNTQKKRLADAIIASHR